MSEATIDKHVKTWKRPRKIQQLKNSWVTEIPARWNAKRLKFVVDVSNERLSEKPSDVPYIGLEHLDSKTGKLTLDNEIENVESNMAVFREGDVLFGKLRPYLAKVAAPPFSGVCSTELLVYRPSPEVISDFLKYQLLSKEFIAFVDASAYGTKMPRVNERMMGNTLIVLPPLAEQRAIAAFLDRETARIDALVAKKKRLIELLEEKRRVIISRVVTKGLRPNIELKPSGVEWFGDIPSHWTVLPAKRVSSIFVPERSKPEINFENDGHPWITTEDIGAEYLEFSRINRFVSEIAAEVSGSRLLPAHSVIASCVGRFSLSSINPTECVINQQLQAFIPHSIEPSFLRLLVQVSETYFERAATITTLKYVSQVKFADMPVLDVPPTEQKEILESIRERTSKLNAARAAIERSVERLSEYRISLISAAVNGQIDVREEVQLDE